jgi:hypothetical protein
LLSRRCWLAFKFVPPNDKVLFPSKVLTPKMKNAGRGWECPTQ